MSNGDGGTAPQAARRHDAIRALLRAGKNDDAIVRLCAIGTIRPDDLVARELLFDAFFQKRDWLPALALAEELVRRQPDIARLQKALIATLSNMKRYEETIVQAARYIERHGEDLTMLDALKVAHFYTGKIDEAVRYGQRALSCATPKPAATRRRCGDRSPRPAGGPKRHLVFAVGTAPFYAYGAMINLVLARTVYPDWSCRYYVGADGAKTLRRLPARQRRRCPQHRGRISRRRPVPTLPGDERSKRRTFSRSRLRRAIVEAGGRSGAAMDRQRLSVPRDARPCAA